MNYGKLNCRGKVESKLPADAGFICDRVPMTAAMLRNITKDTLFKIPNLRFLEWC
jgi:hypothetical protein